MAAKRAVFYSDKDDRNGIIFEEAMHAQRRAMRGLAGLLLGME